MRRLITLIVLTFGLLGVGTATATAAEPPRQPEINLDHVVEAAKTLWREGPICDDCENRVIRCTCEGA